MDEQYQIVDVPGHGEVDFPASMSDADVLAAIKRLTFEGPRQPPPAPAPPSDMDRAKQTMERLDFSPDKAYFGGAPAGAAAPIVKSALRTAGRAAGSPTGQAAIGGIVGYVQGGWPGALTGAAGGGAIGRLTKALQQYGARRAGMGKAAGLAKAAPTRSGGPLLWQATEHLPNSQEAVHQALVQQLSPARTENIRQQMHNDFILRALDKVPIIGGK